MAEIVVVGAGVLGASIAYRFARAGARVTVVDRGVPGRGTSATSFAWVNSNHKQPRAYHRLNAESVVAHRRLRENVAQDLGAAEEARWLHEGGGLEWTDTEQGRTRLLANAARLRKWGYAVQVIDEAEVHRLEPHLRTDGLTAATFCPDEAWVDGPLMAAQLCAAAARLGATVRSGGDVHGLERDGARVTGVRLRSGERIDAECVIVAAGLWTDRVAALAGVGVPLAPTCGLLAVTSPVAEGVGRVVYAPGMNFRPETGGGLVLQSEATDKTVTVDTPPRVDLPGCAELFARILRFLPSVSGWRIVEARVGVRPMPEDGYPVVGPVEERPGLYLCVTHSGVTLSALFGELVAAEITGGGEDERLAAFRPGRCVTVQA